MNIELDRIYKIGLINGRHFCALCTGVTGAYVTFTNSKGLQTQHRVIDIWYAIPVVV